MNDKLDFYLIDDSEVNNYYTEDLLNEFDFTGSVTIYAKAAEALEALIFKFKNNEKLPDVILLDIRMSEMDGFEFLEELEQEFEEDEFTSKIFMLTSSKHRKDLESFDRQIFATEFLNKPLEGEVLEPTIKKYFS